MAKAVADVNVENQGGFSTGDLSTGDVAGNITGFALSSTLLASLAVLEVLDRVSVMSFTVPILKYKPLERLGS